VSVVGCQEERLAAMAAAPTTHKPWQAPRSPGDVYDVAASHDGGRSHGAPILLGSPATPPKPAPYPHLTMSL
jgi:hypothetical protein